MDDITKCTPCNPIATAPSSSGGGGGSAASSSHATPSGTVRKNGNGSTGVAANAPAVAHTTTTTATTTKGNTKNGSIPTHRVCDSCHALLERQFFSKKDYLRKDEILCQPCKQRQTAQRLGQKPVPSQSPSHQSTTLHKQQGRIAESGFKRRPNNFGYCTYLDRLFGLACFADLASLGVFTSAKDVSESMAALQGAVRYGNFAQSENNNHGVTTTQKNPKIHCWCVGDGSTPRSAVLAAFLQGWTCWSIDPALRPEWNGHSPRGVRGLFGYRGTLEDFVLSCPWKNLNANANATTNPDNQTNHPEHLIILCVHSHARFLGSCTVGKIRACYNTNNSPLSVTVPITIVSLPCCPKFRHVGDIKRPPDIQYEDDCVFSACRQVDIWNF